MESGSVDPLATNPSIVLIHGLWMTPRSCEHWKERFEHDAGEVITPAYPGVGVEALREDASPIANLNVRDTLAHTWVNFENDERAPLLFTAAGVDHVMPAAGNRSNCEYYASAS